MISAAVRLNSKLEVSARRKKAFTMAVEAGGVAIAELSGEDKGIRVRDHLILSATPSNTPQKKRYRSQNDEKGGAGWDDTDDTEDGDSVESRASSEDSDSAKMLTPRGGSSRIPKQGRWLLSLGRGVQVRGRGCSHATGIQASQVGACGRAPRHHPGIDGPLLGSQNFLPAQADSRGVQLNNSGRSQRQRGAGGVSRESRACVSEAKGDAWLQILCDARPWDAKTLRILYEELIDIISRGTPSQGQRRQGSRRYGQLRPSAGGRGQGCAKRSGGALYRVAAGRRSRSGCRRTAAETSSRNTGAGSR